MTKVSIIHFLCLLFALTIISCDTKNDYEDAYKNYFIKYYGEDGKQVGVDMIVNADGTILLLGNTISPEDSSKVLLIMVDAAGNILWQKKLPPQMNPNTNKPYNEVAVDIEPAINPGEFVILSNLVTGIDDASKLNQYQIKLQIITIAGESLNKKITTILTPPSPVLNDLVGYSVSTILNRSPGNSFGYMVTGNTSDTDKTVAELDPDLNDIVVLYFNQDLTGYNWDQQMQITNQKRGSGINVFESKTYNESAGNDARYKDRPFYLFGYSDATSAADIVYDNNFWLAPFKTTGVPPLFDNFIGDSSKEEIMSQTIEDHGSGFISVGSQTTGSTSKLVIAQSQVDGDGLKFSSDKIIEVEGTSNLKSVSITLSKAGGRYLILSNETNVSGATNIWLSKVSINGDVGVVMWSASFGSIIKSDFAGTVRELEDGRIVILGTVEQESQNVKMVLMKLNSSGEFLN